MRLREIDVFSVKIEREKLGKDARNIIRIFSIMEENRISCEFVAKNIDWISISVREEYVDKTIQFMQQLSREIAGINITSHRDITLLVVEQYEFDTRAIGLLFSYLELQGIDIKMFRQIRNSQKIVVGVRKAQFDHAKDIVLNQWGR